MKRYLIQMWCLPLILLITIIVHPSKQFASAGEFSRPKATHEVVLADRKFNIPVGLISGNPKDMATSEGVVLRYLLPDFKPARDLTVDEENVALDEDIVAGALLQSAVARPLIDLMVSNRRKLLASEKDLGVQYGLHAYEWYLGSPDGPRLKSTVYLEYDASGKIISFIECKADRPSVPNYSSSCSDKFVKSGILYDHFYNKKKYLTEWKERRETLVQFVENLEVKN